MNIKSSSIFVKRPLKHITSLLFVILSLQQVAAQEPARGDMKFNLNESGSLFLKPGVLNQTWIRWNQSNSGSTLAGSPTDQTFDIGLRRTRFTLVGQVTDRISFFAQAGMNNFQPHSPRKLGWFIHDFAADYALIPGKLFIGTGLAAYKGHLRHSAPSVGTILMADAPIYQQATNDISDQFVRMMMVYAKGKLGRLDYRLALSDPFETVYAGVPPINGISNYSTEPANLMTQGYFKWEFREQESNINSYHTGTWLGTKEVVSLGAGFATQRNAMWHLEGSDTTRTALGLFGLDFFYDRPLNKSLGTALTVYSAISYTNFGPGYVRNVGVMNANDGFNAATGSFNGAGNAFPMVGTGSTFYVQAGYLLKKDLLDRMGTLQPFAALQLNDFERLADPVAVYNIGFSWLMKGHGSKLSFDLQSRPVFMADASGAIEATGRKSMFVIQHQFSF